MNVRGGRQHSAAALGNQVTLTRVCADSKGVNRCFPCLGPDLQHPDASVAKVGFKNELEQQVLPSAKS